MDINDDSYSSDYMPSKKKKKSLFSSLMVMTGLSLILGFVAAFGIWEYLSKQQDKVKKLAHVENLTRKVIVSSREIKSGVKITPEDISFKETNINLIPKDSFTKPDQLIGRVTKSTIPPDSIVLDSSLNKVGAKGGLTAVIPKGNRAITVRVNDITGVGGFINPGDKVDILSVTDSKVKGELVSKTVLQNVFVIAVGEKIYNADALPEQAEPKGVNQITLSLNLIDAEKLALASQKGDVRFILRAFDDEEEVYDPGVDSAQVYDNEFLASAEVAPAPQKPIKRPVDIILGNNRTTLYF